MVCLTVQAIGAPRPFRSRQMAVHPTYLPVRDEACRSLQRGCVRFPLRTASLERLPSHMIDVSLLGNSRSFIPPHRLYRFIPPKMSTAGEVRAALNTSMTGSQKNTNVATVRRGPVRPATGSGSSGGVGPVRSTRPRTNISADTDIKTVRPFHLGSTFFP